MAARTPLKFFLYVVRRFCFRDVLFESKAWSYLDLHETSTESFFQNSIFYIFLLWVYELPIFKQIFVF